MTAYILLVIMSSYNYNLREGRTLVPQEFNGKATCEVARAALEKQGHVVWTGCFRK